MPSFRSGRRYRFGRPAAFVAIGYMLTVLVAAVIALTDDDRFLWRLLFSDYRSGPREDPTGWSVLLPVLAGGAQGWALWQILRGRVAGDRARPRGAVRWLRWALYANLVLHLLFYRFLDYPDAWWVNVCWSLLELALVLLFHRVLTGVSRPLRFTVLAAGTFVMIASIGAQVTGALGLDAAGEMFGHALLDGTSWTLWTVLLIVAQARDGRWGRTTVWAGVASLAMPLLIPSLLLGFHSPGEDSYPALVISIWAVSHIFTPVWLARSAHDLAGPDVGAVPGRRRPAPVRAPLGWWPLPVIAAVLPLLPALVGLDRGVPFWIGPRGVVGEHLSESPAQLWLYADFLVGIGGLALLALVVVVRRTRRLAWVTVCTLLLAAVVGVVTALTTPPDPEYAIGSGGPVVRNISLGYGGPEMYPDWVFASEAGGGSGFLGISPLWHSAAFAVSALILLFRYGWSPARRSPYRTAALAVTVSILPLCLLPAADQSRGPFTSKEECERLRSASGPYGEDVAAAPLGPEPAFVCEVRESTALPGARDAPDLALVAYGRRLCGVYTRDDPAEIARVRSAGDVDVRDLTYTIDEICPSAAAVAKAGSDADEREMREWEEERQRMCDAALRHRPRIRPDSVTVVKEPVWPENGTLEAYEETAGSDPLEGRPYELLERNGLVAAVPGRLVIDVHADAVACVTTETYTRRPPVETRGWHHVVEVGYRSPGGEIVLSDPMGGSTLPDLALRGRSGDYRIRVHHAWLPSGAQRLLIMAYPGRGDDVVIHRKRIAR
ncbi:hypothetical protein [Planobispora longispora]|uniref:hypothetical protein n=1 Tax=Planobispora longispora TaxID=28887 RepID=UPI0019440443|nr:hypothetical protein [Planobispora longispora]